MKKNAKIIIAAAVVVVAIVGIIAGILIANNGNKDPLIGSWANGSYIYTFNEDGTCSYAYSGAGAMECTYETDGDKISILYTENTVPFENIETLTPAEICEICKKEPQTSGTNIGKLIEGYRWYYVAPISAEDTQKIEKGKSFPVQFASHLAYEVYFTVVNLETDDEGNSTVIFSCDNINSELACVRNEPVTVRLASYSGIGVNSDALRVVDGVQGVYIARGQKVAFRKVIPLYTGDGYIVSKIDKTDPSSLAQYDEIIIGGKKLYDGGCREVFSHYMELEKIGLAAPQVTYLMADTGKTVMTVEEAVELL